MIITITVTAEDVRLGIVGSWGWNPIARAIARVLPDGEPVLGGNSWWWAYDRRRCRVRLFPPADAVERLKEWQEGKGMQAFSFEMEVPL